MHPHVRILYKNDYTWIIAHAYMLLPSNQNMHVHIYQVMIKSLTVLLDFAEEGPRGP